MTADKLVQAYVRMRDAIKAADAERDAKVEAIQKQLDAVSKALLAILDKEGLDGVKSEYGHARKVVSHTYWVPDWDAFSQFVREHGDLDLLQRRLHQGNFADFMERNPDLVPPVSSNNEVTIRVTRSKNK